MAETIVGKQVVWGISSNVKTVSDTVLTGIVQDASATRDGNVTEIQDEDGDHVTRIDHGTKNEVSVTLISTTDPVVLPAKGDEITFGAVTSIDGIDVSTGRAFIDSSSSTQAGASATQVSFTFAHYPQMLADA